MPKRTASVDHDISSGKRGSKAEEETIEKIQEEPEVTSKTLKDLIFLGRVSKSVQISNYTFELQTLTAVQQREVYADLMEGEEARLPEIKPIVLSRAVSTINGSDLKALAENDGLDIYDVVSSWQIGLIDRLYEEYEKMVEESNEEVGAEAVKK